MQSGTGRDKVAIVREALARFNSESPGLVFIADEIADADSDVIVVGRVQKWRHGDLYQERSMALLWEFADDDVVGIDQFASEEEARAAARSGHARPR